MLELLKDQSLCLQKWSQIFNLVCKYFCYSV